MNNSELEQLIHNYAEPVIQRLQSYDLTSIFQDCSALLLDRMHGVPAWQIALPVISSVAAGGTLEAGYALATAWIPGYLASEILDNVEDKEFIPDRLAPTPEIATNLATSLIFFAFHALAAIPDPERACQVTRIFSQSGFEAAYGQHRDLMSASSSVEESLNDFWEMIILKSGSVFRTATAGGAAAGTSDERYIDALGDYGTALGVMLQLLDDCRDVFTPAKEKISWQISLPLLLYLMTIREATISFPPIETRAAWSDLLRKTGVINAIASLLLEWKIRALESLEPLRMSTEKQILESIPSLFLERYHLNSTEALDGNPS
jgi:hypothetical protein